MPSLNPQPPGAKKPTSIMSSSLARTRSMRTTTAATAPKPAAPLSRASSTRDSSSEPRNALALKAPVRTVSAASSSSSSSTSLRTASTRVPISGVVGRAASTRLASGSAKDVAARKEKATTTMAATAATSSSSSSSSRYPPSTTLTRPSGQTRPRSSGATSTSTSTSTTTAAAAQPAAKRLPGHTRSKSTVTSLNAATVLQPPSAREQQTSRAGTPTTASGPLRRRTSSIDKAIAPKALPSKTQTSSRLSSGPSATTTAAAAPTASTTSAPTATAPAPAAQPKLRPAFSTLQQHYSPAKSLAPKPLTSTFLAPPSPSKLPANVAASAEISKLQAELLQLHLLRRDAATVDAQWRASAKEKLGERFAKLCESSGEVAEQERVVVERQNVLALRRWGNGGGLDEKIQSLEAIISGVWSLSDPGGRYARVVRRFERWIDKVCEVEEARRKGTGLLLQGQDTLFIGELDDSWKEEREGLVRRLDGWRRQLSEIDHLPHHHHDRYDNAGDASHSAGEGKSSLARMLEGSRDLMNDMLAELNVMEQIEQEALAREDEWIERMNRDDDDDHGDDDDDGDDYTPRAGAVWRAV